MRTKQMHKFTNIDLGNENLLKKIVTIHMLEFNFDKKINYNHSLELTLGHTFKGILTLISYIQGNSYTNFREEK